MSVAQTLPYGKLKLMSIDGTAEVDATECRPASGRQWRLVELWGYHNDTGSAKNSYFRYHTAGPIYAAKTPIAALGAGDHLDLCRDYGTEHSLLGPIVLTYDTYLDFITDSLGAGKSNFLRGLYYEYGDNE